MTAEQRVRILTTFAARETGPEDNPRKRFSKEARLALNIQRMALW